jgi:hypothetical protein
MKRSSPNCRWQIYALRGQSATSYLEVLDSNTREFTAQLALAQAQLNELQSLVRIYRALGGGVATIDSHRFITKTLGKIQ